jgi:hypothetical protein
MLDFSKVSYGFDILLSRIYKIGIQGDVMAYFLYTLKTRSNVGPTSVSVMENNIVKDYFSELETIRHGASQESILSPFLFPLLC